MSVTSVATAFKPQSAVVMVGIESTEGTQATMTLAANVIPTVDFMVDYDMTQATPALESPTGGVYLAGTTAMKLSGSFTTYLHGGGVDGSSNPNSIRFLTHVLQTCGNVVVDGGAHTRVWYPVLSKPTHTDASSTVTTPGASFSVTAYVAGRGRTDVAASGSEKLSTALVNCKVSKLTFTEMTGDLTKVDVEFLGMPYSSQEMPAEVQADLDNFAYEKAPAYFWTSNQNTVQIGGTSAFVEARTTTIDYGTAHVLTDGSKWSVGGIALGDISVTGTVRFIAETVDEWTKASAGTIVAIECTGSLEPANLGLSAAGYVGNLTIPNALIKPKWDLGGNIAMVDAEFVAGKATAETDRRVTLTWS